MSGWPVCDAWISECRCSLPLEHTGPHECKCGGSWDGSDGEPGGVTEIYSFPQSIVGPAL